MASWKRRTTQSNEEAGGVVQLLAELNLNNNVAATPLGGNQNDGSHQVCAGAAVADGARIYNEENVLALGLELVGFPPHRQMTAKTLKLRRFRSFFGVGPKALAELCHDLSRSTAHFDNTFLFLAVNFLCGYDTEHVLAGRWGFGEEKIRNSCRSYVKFIQALKERKVTWGGFDDGEVFIISVDGVHCRIQEPRTDPGAKWYDHKTNSAGVSYELGVAIRRNQLVWIKGPFPASQHDITTFRSKDAPGEGLIDKIAEGKRAVGDSGYQGEPNKITITREGHSKELKKYLGRVKSRHETFNSRIKSFKVLDTAFRHGFKQHQQCFEAVCILVQYDIENGHGLFEV
jgi:hypothetical protein